MPDHICPYGLKSKHLLESRGYHVDDRWLETREATDAFKVEQDVKTTPQTFIDGVRIGGYDDLRRHFGLKVADPDATAIARHRPVCDDRADGARSQLCGVCGNPFTMRAAEWFISFSMIILALLKLQDVDKFATMFLNYDLLARRWVPYASIYPFAEGLAGMLMTAQCAAVVVDSGRAVHRRHRRGLGVQGGLYRQARAKCACVGGGSKVPLGFVSLTENLMMVAMAFWMLWMLA